MPEFCKTCGQKFVVFGSDQLGNPIYDPACECNIEYEIYDDNNDTSSEINTNYDFDKDLEESARIQFAQLKSKYGLMHYLDQRPICLLNEILMLIDEGKQLKYHHLNWLKQPLLFQFAGFAYYQNFLKTGNGIELATACSCYRKARLPEKGIEVTDNFLFTCPYKDFGAIYTTRGGALKDIGSYDLALECANNALVFSPNDFRPHNLLGAIYFAIEQLNKGIEHFDKARQLGSPEKKIQYDMNSSLKKWDAELQQQCALLLLNRDPVCYDWARKYIKSPSPIHNQLSF